MLIQQIVHTLSLRLTELLLGFQVMTTWVTVKLVTTLLVVVAFLLRVLNLLVNLFLAEKCSQTQLGKN